MGAGICRAGIDGGGTKTLMRLADAQGNTIWEGAGGSTNLCSNTIEQVRDNLQDLFTRALAETGAAIQAICLGSAGVTYPNARQILGDMLKECAHCSLVRVVGDMEIPLEAEARREDALVLAAGTGSVCYGRNTAGESARSGGWGHIFGDEGSGYWIACQGLKAVARAYDGRAKPTLLTELFLEGYGAQSIADIAAKLYGGPFGKSAIAGMAGLVDKAATRGDPAALRIIGNASRHLCDLADAVARKIRPDGLLKMLLSGGVALSPLVREALTARLRKIYPLADIRPVRIDSAWGALIIAKELCEE